jgi:hypothetical protein
MASNMRAECLMKCQREKRGNITIIQMHGHPIQT